MPNVFRNPPRLPLVAPSILSADFAEMKEECRSVLGAPAGVAPAGDPGAGDLLHLDVMDGHFVPNLTMGPDMCRSLRRAFPSVMLDVHLMVSDPGRFVGPFRDAGADHLTFHIEPSAPGWRSPAGGGGGPDGRGFDPVELATAIRAAGMSVGLAVNPPTDPVGAMAVAEAFDLILVMSVNPGFSGQRFIRGSLDTARAFRARLRPGQRLEMDGGITPADAAACRDAGADVLVAASAVFGAPRGPNAARNQVITAIRGSENTTGAGLRRV